MPSSHDSQSVTTVHNHDRNLALLFVATGAIFGIYGSGLGSLMLASLSGFRLPLQEIGFASHPYAQIYGFIFEFIMGVAYILVPRFKGERLTDILSSLKRRRFYFCFLLLLHPSRSESVLQASILEFRGRSCPERCLFRGISASLCTHPCLCAIRIYLYPKHLGVWRCSKPVMDRYCRGSILHAFSLKDLFTGLSTESS